MPSTNQELTAQEGSAFMLLEQKKNDKQIANALNVTRSAARAILRRAIGKIEAKLGRPYDLPAHLVRQVELDQQRSQARPPFPGSAPARGTAAHGIMQAYDTCSTFQAVCETFSNRAVLGIAAATTRLNRLDSDLYNASPEYRAAIDRISALNNRGRNVPESEQVIARNYAICSTVTHVETVFANRTRRSINEAGYLLSRHNPILHSDSPEYRAARLRISQLNGAVQEDVRRAYASCRVEQAVIAMYMRGTGASLRDAEYRLSDANTTFDDGSPEYRGAVNRLRELRAAAVGNYSGYAPCFTQDEVVELYASRAGINRPEAHARLVTGSAHGLYTAGNTEFLTALSRFIELSPQTTSPQPGQYPLEPPPWLDTPEHVTLRGATPDSYEACINSDHVITRFARRTGVSYVNAERFLNSCRTARRDQLSSEEAAALARLISFELAFTRAPAPQAQAVVNQRRPIDPNNRYRRATLRRAVDLLNDISPNNIFEDDYVDSDWLEEP